MALAMASSLREASRELPLPHSLGSRPLKAPVAARTRAAVRSRTRRGQAPLPARHVAAAAATTAAAAAVQAAPVKPPPLKSPKVGGGEGGGRGGGGGGDGGGGGGGGGPPNPEPLRIILAGAPASGKGTQCELIVEKFGLVHISAGDLLRAEVQQGTPNGTLAKGFMDAGQLVPDEVVVKIVKDRLTRLDAQRKGWLLDGFPRSESQANALVADGIHADLFILLQVPDEVIVERVVGRRMDPETGRIYHLTFSPPPPDPGLLSRLVQRSDDSAEQARARLDTHARNVDSVLSLYQGRICEVDGNRDKKAVFADISSLLASLKEKKQKALGAAGAGAFEWKGMPTRLNDIPHSRQIRQYFYADVCRAVSSAVASGLPRLQVDLLIPELNPEMDVYRIGTLLELMRELAFTFAAEGKRVKVCVQGAMGSGIFTGMPLQLSGTRRLLEAMDWGQEEEEDSKAAGLAQRIAVGAIGATEVSEGDEVFILMAPQNAVGNCILENLQAMTEAAGDRPVILINPRLKDVPSSAGVMQVQGRAERLEYQGSFVQCYMLKLLFQAGTQYPILGAVRLAHPGGYEVYKRADVSYGVEEYRLCDTFSEAPSSADVAAAFAGKKRSAQGAQEPESGLWGFFAKLLN